MTDPKDEEPELEAEEPDEFRDETPEPPIEPPPFLEKPRKKPAPKPKPVAKKVPKAKPISKPKPALPSKTKNRPATGWFRHTVSWIGLIMASACAAMLICDVKVTGLRIEFPTFWKDKIEPGELVVLIDAGHGGHDSGARGNLVVEKDLNLDVARRVKQELDRRGIRSELTRTSDRFLALGERTALANRIGNCVFVSIHFNDAKDKGAAGLETYYSTEKVQFSENTWVRTILGFIYQEEKREDDSRQLAEAIQAALVEATGATDRGVKDRRLYVVRRTPHPAVLVEGGFVSNPDEAKKLADPNYRETLAKAVAEGLIDYLGTSQRLRTASNN